MADESVKPVLNTLAGYEPNHENPPFSTNDAKGVKANLTSVTAAIQDPKYNLNPNKPTIWLRRFMKAQNIDYVKDSSLKHRLWLLKLQGVTQ